MVPKRVDSVSGYTVVFKIKGQCTLCIELRALVPFWVIRCSRYSRSERLDGLRLVLEIIMLTTLFRLSNINGSLPFSSGN